MKKLLTALIMLPLLASCGTTQVSSKPVVLPIAKEEKMVSERQRKLIEEKVRRPNLAESPRVIYAKPVWIPSVIRKIYIPSHEAPDGSMVAGYYLWKKVVPGRWRKPGEKVGEIPVRAVYRTEEVKKNTVEPQDAEAILNFLKEMKERR